MPLLGGYKVVLTLAGALAGGVLAGTSLGGFAVGDAFFFYRSREPLPGPIEVSQAAAEPPAYSSSPYPPLVAPAAYARPGEFSPAWRTEAYLETPYELSETYGAAGEAEVRYADIADVDGELGPDMSPVAVPVSRTSADDDEWESVGDAARMRPASQSERSDPTGQAIVRTKAPAFPPQRGLDARGASGTAGRRSDLVSVPDPQAQVPAATTPLHGAEPGPSDPMRDQGTPNSSSREG